MTALEEYAALARQLSAQRRGADRAAIAEAERRRALQAGLDQLGRRLAAQRQRLGQLGRAIGAATPGTDLAVPSGADTASSDADLAAASGPAVPLAVPAPTVMAPSGPGHSGAVGSGGAAAVPGRPGVGAYGGFD
ncbi:hypothetical protein DKT69_02690, partial [Micromonospora sicca]